MKTAIILVVLALLCSACATSYHTAELGTRLAPSVQLRKGGTVAFLPEEDMRGQKAAFYGRVESYLEKAGYIFTTPEKADYLIQVIIRNGLPATSECSAPRVNAYIIGTKQPEVLYHYSLETAKSEGPYVEFDFFAYPGSERNNLAGAARCDLREILGKAVWTASTIAAAADFRRYEERYVQAIFSHFAENYDGWMSFKEEANKSPEATTLARTPAADAPVAPAVGRASS